MKTQTSKITHKEIVDPDTGNPIYVGDGIWARSKQTDYIYPGKIVLQDVINYLEHLANGKEHIHSR